MPRHLQMPWATFNSSRGHLCEADANRKQREDTFNLDVSQRSPQAYNNYGMLAASCGRVPHVHKTVISVSDWWTNMNVPNVRHLGVLH